LSERREFVARLGDRLTHFPSQGRRERLVFSVHRIAKPLNGREPLLEGHQRPRYLRLFGVSKLFTRRGSGIFRYFAQERVVLWIEDTHGRAFCRVRFATKLRRVFRVNRASSKTKLRSPLWSPAWDCSHDNRRPARPSPNP